MALNWSAWGPPIQSWTFGVPVASIPFLNLSLYNRLLFDIQDVQHNSGTPDLAVQVSEDNGVTWVSGAGDYIRWGVTLTGQTSIIMASAVAVTPVVSSGLLIINNFNVARKASLGINGGRNGASTGAQQMGGRVNRAIARSAAQLIWSSGTNFVTSGAVDLYGMP